MTPSPLISNSKCKDKRASEQLNFTITMASSVYNAICSSLPLQHSFQKWTPSAKPNSSISIPHIPGKPKPAAVISKNSDVGSVVADSLAGGRLYLGMDFGTSGARYALIDGDGNLLSEGKRNYPKYMVSLLLFIITLSVPQIVSTTYVNMCYISSFI